MSKKILIVNNIEDELILITDILKSSDDSHLIIVCPISEGFKIFNIETPDLVIIDVFNSFKEGIGLIRDVRAINSVPIVAIGENDGRIGRLALESGANSFIVKPYDRNEISAKIKILLGNSENRMSKENENISARLVSDRTRELEKELKKRVEAEAELKKMVQYIESSKIAALNLMDDLQEEILEREIAQQELERSKLQLRELNTYVQQVREKEKAEISREIHDVLGQALTALKFDLLWIKKSIPDFNEELDTKFEQMKELIDDTTVSVQRISTELRPGLLDDLGLTYALEWQTGKFEERTDIKCTLNFEPEEIILDEKYSVELFRIAQESLTNVARHSEATEVSISLKFNNNQIELIVADNGKGIDEEMVKDPKSLGLLGISERVYNIGGSVVFSGKKNIGTEVKVLVDLNK